MKLARFMSEGRLHRNLGRLKFKINDRHPVFFLIGYRTRLIDLLFFLLIQVLNLVIQNSDETTKIMDTLYRQIC